MDIALLYILLYIFIKKFYNIKYLKEKEKEKNMVDKAVSGRQSTIHT